MLQNVSDLDSVLWKRMVEIVLNEKRPFSFVDFVPTFEVDERMYSISHGTLRNKIYVMLKAKKIRVLYHGPQAFYTINGKEFETPMTDYPIWRKSTGISSNSLMKLYNSGINLLIVYLMCLKSS